MDEARRNGEVIRMGNSQLLSTLRKLKDKPFDPEELAFLEAKERKLRKKAKDFSEIKEVRDRIDEILFVPEVVSIHVDNISHYKAIIKNGLFINDKRYVRLLSGAGNLRRNTVIFIDERFSSRILGLFDNNRDTSLSLNPAKYNAYFGLYNSSGIETIFPNIVVIPDYEFQKQVDIDWIDENNQITKVKKDVTLNAFDGQGIVAFHMAERWAQDLELDYIPSTFIFRAPFAKGQLVTFPVDEFIRTFGSIVTDVWGEEQDLRFADIILSQSQLKLWQSYESAHDYVQACHRNGLGFFITRVSPRTPSSFTTSNYMFINALGIESQDEIENLCADTIAHINDVSGMDIQKMKLFLGGRIFDDELTQEGFWKLNPIVRALMINPDIQRDPHVVSTIIGAIEETTKKSYLGKLFLVGNYAPLVADPFAQMQWALGQKPTGLLEDGEHFYRFWSNKGVDSVACGRSPLTHPSEMIVADIVSRPEHHQWYKYQQTSFILPTDSIDTILMADSDFDGDMGFSTSNPVFINSKETHSPISYDKRVATKRKIDASSLWESDISGFFSKVGFITNVSSTFHTMKYMFEKGSPERIELNKRLKLLRMYQGEEIDSAKNADDELKRVIPEEWVKWNKADGMEFENSILADKRPAYMRWLYSHYDRDYRRELSIFDVISYGEFGLPMNELLLSKPDELTGEQAELVERFVGSSDFLHVPSPMNEVSKHMQRQVREGRRVIHDDSSEYDYRILLSEETVPVDRDRVKKMMELATYYGELKRSLRDADGQLKFKNVEQVVMHVRNRAYRDISPNGTELADLAVIVCYGVKKHSRSFLWNIFGEELVINLMERYGTRIEAIKKDYSGEIEYLFSKYGTYLFDVSI